MEPTAEQLAWLEQRLDKTPAPYDYATRNWVQYMLIDAYSQKFGTNKLEALRHIADKFADRFPH